MRRNILAYPAPAFSEGYDLICINPDPCAERKRFIRVQVKSRMATEANGFPVKQTTLGAFDYLILVLLNLGYHRFRLRAVRQWTRLPGFGTVPDLSRHLPE